MALPPDVLDRRKRLRPKVYSLGIYAVGLFILAEIVVLGSAFWMRQRVILETEGPTLVVSPKSEEGDEGASPPLPTINLPSARLPVEKNKTPVDEILTLNDEGRNFRRNGDFAMAEAALKKAQAIDPNHPLTLTNLAMLEEAQGRNARALDYWKQVIALGDKARDTIQLARERSVVMEDRIRLEEEARRAEQSPTTGSGRRFSVDRVITQPDPMPERPVEIQRDFVLKSAPGKDILQSSKLRVQVYFYDRIGTDRLVSVPIEARFLNENPDWNAHNEEVLRVRYLAAKETGETRRYYGYVFRIYYEGVLQEERAEPANLLRLNPAR